MIIFNIYELINLLFCQQRLEHEHRSNIERTNIGFSNMEKCTFFETLNGKSNFGKVRHSVFALQFFFQIYLSSSYIQELISVAVVG